jgi:hypothetical protein
MIKNILVIKCFGVFSIVIACAYTESHMAAARTTSFEWRRADLIATLVWAQGGESPGEFARSMSRRQILQRREFLSLPGTDWHSKTLPKCVIRPRANRAMLPVSQWADQPCAELIEATGLLAGLIFHQLRPGSRAAAGSEQSDSPRAGRGCILAGTPAAGSVSSLRPERAGVIAPANSLELTPTPMEILFAELAARRLRSLLTRER